ARTGVKPMTLELGGKSPQLVFADADLDKAAAAIAGSVTFNAGQACVAGTRLIVEKSVAGKLTASILEKMKAVKPGPTWDETTRYSPIISERQRGRVDAIVRAAVEGGGECLTGGTFMDSPGYFYEPTLIANVDQANPAIVEEIFGPVLTVQTFETEDEALALSSHPTYGLASGLFTADLSRTIRLARKLEAGTVWVNRYSRSRDHILPTGGYKRSGIGKDLGREAYLANRRTKSVLISL
ncbi:MAG: aldehyde dehydrogenase family protein, partial [Mesorhizobium sp.]